MSIQTPPIKGVSVNVIADYESTGELGRGSHGRVYSAAAPDRLGLTVDTVAVKVFDRVVDDNEFGRLLEEVKLYASVAAESDHLVPFHDVGREGDRAYVSLRHYPEGSLERRARHLTKQQVVQVMADVASGAHELHEVGLVHREIKPTNVFVDDAGRGLLGDIGVAHVISPGQTVTGLGISSLATMEPGLVRGETSARASDIWSLGATLHWGLTGRGIFPGLPESSLIAVLRHIMTAQPELAPSGIPGPIRPVLERCLALDRSERFGTAKELADELKTILEGIPA